jgi:hypothetical protein
MHGMQQQMLEAFTSWVMLGNAQYVNHPVTQQSLCYDGVTAEALTTACGQPASPPAPENRLLG